MKKIGFMIMALMLIAALVVPTIIQTTTVAAHGPDPSNKGWSPVQWKHHIMEWSRYSPTDDFDSTFQIDAFDPNITLMQALSLKGGKFNLLAKYAVAALLNAADPDINYPYTEAEVIDIVKAAIVSGEYLSAKRELARPTN